MPRERGLSLVELMLALAILAICAVALGSAYISMTDLSDLTEQEILATNATRAKMAEIQANVDVPYTDSLGDEYTNVNGVFSRYSDTAFSQFSVDGLDAPSGNPSVGTVILHMDETNVPVQLGGPSLDLDGDGTATKTSFQASDTIALVPIEVQTTWQTRRGPITRSRFLLLAWTD